MDGKRKEEILRVVSHFRGKTFNNKIITEFCNLNKIQPIVESELKDYIEQVEHDEAVSSLFPLILKEVQGIKYEPLFITEKDSKAIRKGNDEVRVNIAKLFESHKLKYVFSQKLGDELASLVGSAIESANTTTLNRALQVMLHLAKDKFGADFNYQHVAKYHEDVYGKKEKTIDKPAK